MTAEAVKDAMPTASSISVDIQTIRFSLPEKRLRDTYLTPRIAQEAIIKFDQGETPDPFSFRLQGAHVTTMYTREKRATPHGRLTPAQQESIKKARQYSPTHQGRMVPDHPELMQTVQRGGENGRVSERVGGRPPPTTPFARRREFGLRALKR